MKYKVGDRIKIIRDLNDTGGGESLLKCWNTLNIGDILIISEISIVASYKRYSFHGDEGHSYYHYHIDRMSKILNRKEKLERILKKC